PVKPAARACSFRNTVKARLITEPVGDASATAGAASNDAGPVALALKRRRREPEEPTAAVRGIARWKLPVSISLAIWAPSSSLLGVAPNRGGRAVPALAEIHAAAATARARSAAKSATTTVSPDL